MKLGLNSKSVRVEKYNPKWKTEYLKQEKKLKKALNNFNVQIEHIGSTSIVDCYAKPIIDIAVGVSSLEYGKQLIPVLEKIGWVHTGNADFGIRWFLKKSKGKKATHFIHIEDINSRIWQNHILFRDYLNSHPEKVEEYSEIKKSLELKFKNNRKEYTKQKDPFIKDVIASALKEWNIEPQGEDYNI